MDLELSDDDTSTKPLTSNAKNLIDITVIDPMTKKKEVFKCEEGLLLEEMKFFDLYDKEARKSSSNTAGIKDLDISIQCQISLFKWLIRYINNKTVINKICYKNVH